MFLPVKSLCVDIISLCLLVHFYLLDNVTWSENFWIGDGHWYIIFWCWVTFLNFNFWINYQRLKLKLNFIIINEPWGSFLIFVSPNPFFFDNRSAGNVIQQMKKLSSNGSVLIIEVNRLRWIRFACMSIINQGPRCFWKIWFLLW